MSGRINNELLSLLSSSSIAFQILVFLQPGLLALIVTNGVATSCNEWINLPHYTPPEMKDSILHSSLTSGDIMIMASDLNREKRVEGNTFHLCINCKSENELNSFFSKLSAGGAVTEPLADMPWGGKYGAITDKYGKHWIFNFQKG